MIARDSQLDPAKAALLESQKEIPPTGLALPVGELDPSRAVELRMTINTLATKGQSNRAIARQLDVCEGTVRYHLRRIVAGAVDGCSRQRRRPPCRRRPRLP